MVSLAWVSFLSKDGPSVGRMVCWVVGSKAGSGYVWARVPMSEGALSVVSGTWVLVRGECCW